MPKLTNRKMPITVAATAILGVIGVSVPLAVSAAAAPSKQYQALTAEQKDNAKTIIATVKKHKMSERAMQIAIATALQESSLRNLRGGDRDSVGLFQQRPSMGWCPRGECGQPVPATEAFLGVAKHTPNPGLVDIAGWEKLPLTVAAQRVQRSGFPNAYAKWEPLAKEIVQRHNADPKPTAKPTTPPATSRPTTSPTPGVDRPRTPGSPTPTAGQPTRSATPTGQSTARGTATPRPTAPQTTSPQTPAAKTPVPRTPEPRTPVPPTATRQPATSRGTAPPPATPDPSEPTPGPSEPTADPTTRVPAAPRGTDVDHDGDPGASAGTGDSTGTGPKYPESSGGLASTGG